MKATRVLFFLLYLYSFSQEKNDKEIVYLLFDTTSKERCLIEDGSGNSKYLNKYRKEYQDQGNIICFKICNERFTANKTKSLMDTCSIEVLLNIKVVDIEYLNNKKTKNILKYNPFEKIYLLEKFSKNKVVKYEVLWIDDWIMVD